MCVYENCKKVSTMSESHPVEKQTQLLFHA